MIDAMPSGHAGTTDVTDSRPVGERHGTTMSSPQRISSRHTRQCSTELERSPLVLESACQLRPAAAEAADPLTGLGAHHVNRLAEAELARRARM